MKFKYVVVGAGLAGITIKTVLKKIDSLSSEEKKRVSDAAVQTAMKQTETNTAEYYLKNISRS